MPQDYCKRCFCLPHGKNFASPLIETVSRLVECPEDWVTVELCESKFFLPKKA